MLRTSLLVLGAGLTGLVIALAPRAENHPSPAATVAPPVVVETSLSETAAPADVAVVANDQPKREPSAGRWAGRVAAADRGRLAGIVAAKAGSEIVLPLPDGTVRKGQVTMTRNEPNATRRAGGTLDGGIFSLTNEDGEITGLVQLREEGRAWQIFSRDGRLVLVERQLRDLICLGLPPPPAKYDEAEPSEAEVNAPVPLLSSRPNADHVLYLDFDGEVINDPNWHPQTIDAKRARMSTGEITKVHKLVSGDFAPFDIDVTTDPARYAGAAVGERMRCIITRTDKAAPFAGGVAFLDSFALTTQQGLLPDVCCWVFIDRQPNACAEAISHEFGHTLGLDHDGRGFSQEYYPGHGRGATSWAPIMGVGYYKKITQWSKGDYQGASNTEDDLAIITNGTNGFGYRPDDHGDTRAAASALSANGPIVEQRAVLERSTDIDFFRFETDGGKAALRIKGATGESNADLLVELLDETGTVLLSDNPKKSPTAEIEKNLAAGVYFLSVRPVSKPPEDGKGYPIYGCIDQYLITGKIVGLD